jgi:chemotaxis protein CheX
LELLSENIKQRPLTEFIGKPFDPEVLIKAALDLLRRRKLHEMSKVDLDVQILNSFAQATRTTLMGFAGLEKCEPGKLFMLRPEVKLQFEVTGVIQMSASRFNGSMMVSFPAKTLLKIVEKLLGEPTPEMTEDVAETAGEIINIIWGQTKKLLEADPSGFKSMIPTVIWGSGQKIGSSADAPMMVIPFETEVGDFFVMFAIQVQMHKLVV